MDLNAKHDALCPHGIRRGGFFSGGRAGAYDPAGFWSPGLIRVRGGASVPVGSYKDALKAGWNGQGSVIFHFAGLPLSLRADLNYNHFTFNAEQ